MYGIHLKGLRQAHKRFQLDPELHYAALCCRCFKAVKLLSLEYCRHYLHRWLTTIRTVRMGLVLEALIKNRL